MISLLIWNGSQNQGFWRYKTTDLSNCFCFRVFPSTMGVSSRTVNGPDEKNKRFPQYKTGCHNFGTSSHHRINLLYNSCFLMLAHPFVVYRANDAVTTNTSGHEAKTSQIRSRALSQSAPVSFRRERTWTLRKRTEKFTSCVQEWFGSGYCHILIHSRWNFVTFLWLWPKRDEWKL